MRRFFRVPSCVLVAAAVAPFLGACSSDFGINLPRANFLRPDALSFSGRREEFTLGPPRPEELVDRDGRCAAAAQSVNAPEEGDAPGLVEGGIALQMTECDVVRRAGAPDGVEFGTSAAGGRSVVLTYTGGSRPGIYRFSAGRLYSIERAPEASAPTRQPKAARGKGQH